MALKKAQKGQINESLIQPRREHKWSQEYVAEMIGTTHVSVSRWEQGLADPNPYFRKKLCDLYGKSEEELGLVRKQKTKRTKEPAHSETRHEPVQSPHGLWKMPYTQYPFFTGRVALLQDIHDTLSATSQARVSTVAISGLGGIGKTVTAIEYAYRYRSSYSAVLWANAENYETLALDFEEMAGRSLLNLPEKNEQDQAVVLNAVKHWFSVHNNWLLILDNVENLAEIESFLPRAGHGSVLLTMRDQALGDIVDYKIHLEKMEPEEAATFLLRRTRKLPKGAALDTADDQDQRDANTLSEVLDYLPLALDQAGAYIEETQCSLSDYLDLYEKQHRVLLKRSSRLAIRYRETVATTWSISFQKIERANPMSSDLLRFFAFLHPDAIPEEMIAVCLYGSSSLTPRVSDIIAANKTIEELLKYSLVKRNANDRTLSMHRLVQTVLRDKMDENEQRHWAQRAIHVLDQIFPIAKVATLARCDRYFPHVQVCASFMKQLHIQSIEAFHLLRLSATYLRQRAQFAQSQHFLQQALAIYESLANPPMIELANCLDGLAALHEIQGNFAEAETLYRRVQVICEQALGSEHPELINVFNALALLYIKQHRFNEAEPLVERVQAICESTQQIDQEVRIYSLHMRAELYSEQGRFTEAEALYMKALTMREQILGKDHPDVASILNNLAVLYLHQKKLSEAETAFQRGLRISEKGWGPAHYVVAFHLTNLALIYAERGDIAEAEHMYRRALDILEATLRKEHPETARLLSRLGLLYKRQKRFLEAEQHLQKALAITEQAQGPDHPDVASCLTNLAGVYLEQRKHENIEILCQRALSIFDKKEAYEHPDMLYALSYLITLYIAQERYSEAEVLYRQILAIKEKTDPDYPNMVKLLLNYAKLLRVLEREDEAREVETRAHSMRDK